jgi:phenylacetic acid degradation operon negative regulatory protein
VAVAVPQVRGLVPAVRRLLEESRPKPQSLIGDLIASYWSARDELIPSAALVELLADFGLSAGSSRIALSRLAQKGRIVRAHVGRRTYYRHTIAGSDRVDSVRARVISFGGVAPDWDGRWWLVAFNVPEEVRHVRHALRAGLRELGFGPLYDGVWICPRAALDELNELLARTGAERATVFNATVHGAVDVASVFALDLVARSYARYVRDLSSFAQSGALAQLRPVDAFVLRTIVWDRWRELVRDDPDLPMQLLPHDWPRPRAHVLFERLHTQLELRARERVRGAAASTGPSKMNLQSPSNRRSPKQLNALQPGPLED